MADMEILALGNMVNSSKAMFERRRRILREARKIISMQGPEALNMRDLGKRAAVSTRTIYNAFGCKETVIALAINSYFEKFISHVSFEDDARTFTGALIRQTTSTLRDVDVPHYMKAVGTLYFSPTLHPVIREVLLDMATRPWTRWLSHIRAQRQLEKGTHLPDLLIDLSNLQYAKIHEWVLGTIDDEAFVRMTLRSVLSFLMGVTRGEAKAAVREAYLALDTAPAFLHGLLRDARGRIAAMPLRNDVTPQPGRDMVTAD